MIQFNKEAKTYMDTLYSAFTDSVLAEIEKLSIGLLEAWKQRKHVFICGNGGSAANAIHLANDFIYGVGACGGNDISVSGIKVEALSANSGIISCLANDTGYENIFSAQIRAKAEEGDVLVALSGSGNSQNIINAINEANALGINTYAIVGFSGGKCLRLANTAIHFDVDDMQIAEDTQLIVGHLCMKFLNKSKSEITVDKRGRPI